MEASLAGKNERYRRGETSHTIHVWWARRPHSAMRSLIFSSLCKEETENAEAIMAELAEDASPLTILASQQLLKQHYSGKPRVLDMFGGGGTIAFETKKLDCEAFSIDSNQLSVFIQKCNILFPEEVKLKEALKEIERTGKEVLQNLKNETEPLFPSRKKQGIFGYLWSYTTQCKNCGGGYHLTKRPWLTKKKGKNLSFFSVLTDQHQEILDIKQIGEEEPSFSSHWVGRSTETRCPFCGQVQPRPMVEECADVVLAVISNENRGGKTFSKPCSKVIPSIEELDEKERKILADLGESLPSSRLPRWSGIINPALYGITTHADFLNRRQRLVLLLLISELVKAYRKLSQKDEKLARFVIGALSSLVDQMVDWNCRLSMWIPQNEQVGRAFCGPGVPMLWDYVETDPVLTGPANLWDKLDRIIKGISSFSQQGNADSVHIQHAHAQDLPFVDNYFDAIVTDPPYYDNIYYSLLADFFYTWKRMLLSKVDPALFSAPITNCEHELVATSRRVKPGESPHEKYCQQLTLSIQEAARVIKPEGVFSFVYSHSSVKGWEALIRAFRNSNFYISSVQPLGIERKARPRAVTSQAVNTCMVFVARKRTQTKGKISFSDILDRTENEFIDFGNKLIEVSGWSSEDAGLAVLANVIGLLANVQQVTEVKSDEEAIIKISERIKKNFKDFSIKKRESL